MNKTISHVAVVSLFAALFGCANDKAKESKTAVSTDSTVVELTPAQLASGRIETGAIQRRVIRRTITLNGVIDVPPQNMVSVTCPLGGYIKSIDLLPGQSIKMGQALVTLEAPSFIQLQQDYLVARSRVQFLNEENQRQRDLAATEATSQKSYQQTQADLASQQAILQALEHKLALVGIKTQTLTAQSITRTVFIRSPINGFVSNVFANRGRYVAPTEVLAELIDPRDLHASLTIFEKDLPAVRIGQRVLVQFLSDTSAGQEAEIFLVSRSMDLRRSGIVHCHFINRTKNFVPGMAITGQIKTDGIAELAVPESAILFHKGKQYIFISETKERFRLTEVVVGERENGWVGIGQLRENLQGKELVTKGALNLLGMMWTKQE